MSSLLSRFYTLFLTFTCSNNVVTVITKQLEGEKLNVKSTKKTVKFGGGSVRVFGMFSSRRASALVRLQTRVNTQVY